MKLQQNINLIANKLKAKELCPSLLNISFKKYSFVHFLNDVFSGLKMFLVITPIAISFAMFSGGSPVQALISVGIASITSVIIGGSKYQINSVAWIVSIVSVDIFVKYQYQGMLLVALMTLIVLTMYGRIQLGNLLKYIGNTFLAAIAVYIALIIIITQIQVLLNIPTVYSYQSLWGNCVTLFSGLDHINTSSIYTCLAFIGSLAILKIFFKNSSSYLIYLVLWGIIMLCNTWGVFTLPNVFSPLKTIGQSFFQDLDNNTIFNMSHLLPFSQNVYTDLVLSSFSIVFVISCQICTSTSISKSVTGDYNIQTNMELISTGIANFLSVASGGLFVAPDVDLTMQNIENKTKSIVTLLIIAVMAWGALQMKNYIFEYVPAFAISSILLYTGFHILKQHLSLKYFNFKSIETQIFLFILGTAIEFGFVSATFVGFITALIHFANRMMNIRKTSVHSAQDHDSAVIEFVENKYAYRKNKQIPREITKKIEIVQLEDILQLNIIERISSIFVSCKSFPSVVIIYFKNIPFFDDYALNTIKSFVEIANKHRCTVMITGTNGLLLKFIGQKTKECNSGNVYGYVIPSFAEAMRQILYRFNLSNSNKKANENSMLSFSSQK